MNKIDNPTGIPEDDFQRAGLIDRLSQYLAADPGAWHMRYNLALALLHDGQVDEAFKEFKQVLAESPKHMESLINIGGIHLSRGEDRLALKAFTTALSAWDIPIVRANLAVAYLQLGRLEEAEKELRRVIEQEKGMPDVWTNLGSVLLQTDRLEESAQASRKALELNPEFAMAANNLAVALDGLGQTDEAREWAIKARDMDYPVHELFLKKLGVS